jgi:hypothetical protein
LVPPSDRAIRAARRSVASRRRSSSSFQSCKNSLTGREAQTWNVQDQDRWRALLDQQAFTVQAAGGVNLAGREAIDTFWNTWHDAFPDNHVATVGIHGDEPGGVLEGRFTGTHTGPLRRPTGEISAPGR